MTEQLSKHDYLEALKRALLGRSPAEQAQTLAACEQRFVDGLAAGRSEAEIAAELGDPAQAIRAATHTQAPLQQAAAQPRIPSQQHVFAAQKNPASLLQLIGSALGLLIFNVFMVIPAAVVSALLAALYVAAFTCYVGGIAVTASALAGSNELLLDAPLHFISTGDASGARRIRITIGNSGVHVTQEPRADAVVDTAGAHDSRLVRSAERVAASSVRIVSDGNPDTRNAQTGLGLALVLAGIALFLASIVTTRYAAVGIKRYLQMTMSLLRGSQA